MEETPSSPLGLNITAINPVQRRPTLKNLNAEHALPIVTSVTRMGVTGVKRASFSEVSLTVASNKVKTGSRAPPEKEHSWALAIFVQWLGHQPTD